MSTNNRPTETAEWRRSLKQAVSAGLLPQRIVREVEIYMADHPDEKPSDILSTTGGEPLSDERLRLVEFLQGQGA